MVPEHTNLHPLVESILEAHGAPTAKTYRGWNIAFEYGYYVGTGPNYDVSWEGEEDGYVDNGERCTGRTREDLIAEIDAWFADKNPCEECQGQGSVPAAEDDPDQDPDICLECHGTGESQRAAA